MRVNSTLRIYMDALIAPIVLAIKNNMDGIYNRLQLFKKYSVNGQSHYTETVTGSTWSADMANGGVQEVTIDAAAITIGVPTFPTTLDSGRITLYLRSTTSTTLNIDGAMVASPSGSVPLIVSGLNLIQMDILKTKNSGTIAIIKTLK